MLAGGVGTSTWTAEKENSLKELWADNSLSARDIGNIMGMSRNAVIGKAGRMGLPSRKGAAPPREALNGEPRPKKPRKPRKPRKSKVPLPPQPVKIEDIPVEGGISLLELAEHHCRAVIGYGDDGMARFCGATKRYQTDYCGNIRMAPTGEPLFKGSFCNGHAAKYFQPWRR